MLHIMKEVTADDKLLCSMHIRQQATPAVDYKGEIRKLRNSLDRAKKAFLEGVDTLTEYGETKKRITEEIEKLEEAQKSQSNRKIDINAFRAKLLNAIDILESNASPDQKKEAFRSVVDRVTIEKPSKNIKFSFYV